MHTICAERIFCSLTLLLGSVVQNRRERVVGSCLDLITSIDSGVFSVCMILFFVGVIVPHEGLGAQSRLCSPVPAWTVIVPHEGLGAHPVPGVDAEPRRNRSP